VPQPAPHAAILTGWWSRSQPTKGGGVGNIRDNPWRAACQRRPRHALDWVNDADGTRQQFGEAQPDTVVILLTDPCLHFGAVLVIVRGIFQSYEQGLFGTLGTKVNQ
jgi:hypothetical protein